MRCCCVPFCTSSQRKKEAGVSFHEIRVNTELRERWLRVIARKNWVPNSTSNYSAVCSLHFVEADFRENTKRRMLKPDAVPSVFPHYPSYMKKEPPKERSCSGIQKRKRDSSTDTLASLPSQKIDSRPASAPEVRADTPKEVAEPSGWQQPESVSSSDIQDLPFVTAASDYCQSANILEPPDAQPAEEGAGARALRSVGVQADSRSTASAFLERKKWREKERAWKQRNERLQATVDAYKKGLQQLKEECNVSKFLQVARDSDQGSTKARVVMDQVLNYKAKKPKWCETSIRQCIILRNLSTKSCEYIRTELHALPCRTTLQKYLGTTVGEIGFSELVKQRLNAEMECLRAEQAKMCSLVVDEMRIKQRLEYNKQRDVFLGDVDMGALNKVLSDSERSELANSLLCFLICGLHARFRIPVGYFFTRACTVELLAETTKHVIRKTEQLGFEIVRVVTDNHKINVAAMEILSGGQPKTQVPHPADPSRSLFLAFDQSHILKNIRSQFLA
ncbi:uncharacterized protein LOC119374049 [Rhipicephalus sanguineus]|uniref:uncharacterized protein LOC119374049 n=1 Tax=Rhipicephalus sanguineus TaxID=34632 RepID=UPI0020C38BFB|nr:uncharacterized protein LOC119374049 [Rhipicephalus sanguineus]